MFFRWFSDPDFTWILHGLLMVFWLHFGWLLHHFSILFRSRNLIDFWMAFLMDFYQNWSPQWLPKTLMRSAFSATLPRGVLCRFPWLALAPLWLHFTRFWHPFSSVFIHFGIRVHEASADYRMHLEHRKIVALASGRWFWDGFSVIFHRFCIRISLRVRTSRTLNLNNSMAFCVEIHVFTLLVFHVFPVVFRSRFYMDVASVFDGILPSFWMTFASLFHSFSVSKFDWFLDGIFNGF